MNVLVLRALGLGDLLTGIPALRGIRRHWPRARLWLATPARLTPLVNLVGGVDHVLPQDGLDHPLRCPNRPDVAINLHGRGPQSHRLLAECQATNMLALQPQGPRWRAGEHEVSRWCRMLGWFGIQSDPGDLDLALQRQRTGPAIIHPGAKDPGRRWPVHRFAEVARALEGQGHRVVITGDTAEMPLAHQVAEAAGVAKTRVLAGRTDPSALAMLVSQAPVVVSGDTGVAHLATACRTPSVVMFAGLGPHLWGPPPERPWHRALWHPLPDDPAQLAENPHETTHPALMRITVEEVVQATAEATRNAPGNG